MAQRENITGLSDVKKQEFIDAIWKLKKERSSVDGLSTYDRYVLLHQAAMDNPSTWSGDTVLTRRNHAHRGPVFLPWHREFILRFETDLQRVSGNPELGLPYWDWATDGEGTADEQKKAPIWGIISGDGNPATGPNENPWFVVTDGPLGVEQSRVNDLLNDPDGSRWQALISDSDVWVTVIMTPGGVRFSLLQRQFGNDLATLPNKINETDTLAFTVYDDENWNEQVENSFRNQLEGFQGPGMHNRVHGWIGGTMGPGTSPNDPVFFLHHCNVDRLWERWRNSEAGAPFTPASGGPVGHNLSDFLYPWDGVSVPELVTVENAIDPGDTQYL